METVEDDDDLKLVKASARLLSDLEDALPKLLWKPAKSGNGRRVHSQVKQRDLDHVIRLIDPFQSEPQLLDARLKHLLPLIVEAYLAYVQPRRPRRLTEHLDLETACCILLYTFCKVRGYKVILGFLNNEPKYLETVLLRIEAAASPDRDQDPQWQVSYILLLWLSHLLLTPFDLASISDQIIQGANHEQAKWADDLPAVANRILDVGLYFLPTSTKAQEAAALLLVRLVRRPDMQKLHLADSITGKMLGSLEQADTTAIGTVYERLGPLRLLSGVAASSELSQLIPDIYKACQRHSEDAKSFVATNAVAKKLTVKILRAIAISSLRTSNPQGSLLSFFETTSVLENVIDYLLRSLADKDTPVRFAAAKGISLIVLELDAEMREEVIQAVLDTFKEDMPRNAGQKLDFRTANALRWHGLTLCLAHTLFKRSASPAQLPDIVAALVSALQFEQRTAVGSTVGTNVRDAANFGIWSLSRRYTTDELLSVNSTSIVSKAPESGSSSIIQYIAIELVLSACLDPAGNIRRGSSAALQELIGRHPNQVKEGIALVQIVDYQAVGLRRRAIVDVAVRTTELDNSYFKPVQTALIEWRGLGSVDVASREAAAQALARLTEQSFANAAAVVRDVLELADSMQSAEVELLHGIAVTLASVYGKANEMPHGSQLLATTSEVIGRGMPTLLRQFQSATEEFSSRVLRSELPSAIAAMLAAYCSFHVKHSDCDVDFETIETLTTRLLARGEETIREAIPALARSLLALKRRAGQPLGCLGSQTLMKQVAIDGAKSTLHGAGRAMALGALAPVYADGLRGSKALEIVNSLGSLTRAMTVEWRIIGVRALQLAVERGFNVLEGYFNANDMDDDIVEQVLSAIHRGMNDYTIDERGDIGSLVRLQAIAWASASLAKFIGLGSDMDSEPLSVLQADILRLSLEKLDRVRLAAAQVQSQHLTSGLTVPDIAAVSSYEYFANRFAPLSALAAPEWMLCSLLEGAISAAGIGSEQLLQASRPALARNLHNTDIRKLAQLMTLYTSILKTTLASPTSPITTPALTLLAFLLNMRIPQRLANSDTNFKWLTLLSVVQKSHHKSNDIPRIAAAVACYRGLAEVESVKGEVLKKLLGMLKTNPYPKVRAMVAEVLFVVVDEKFAEVKEILREGNWMEERKGLEGLLMGSR